MNNKVKLTLVGLDGNSFAILGAFKRAAKTQGFEKEWIDGVVRDAMSGDYDHLLTTIVANCEDENEDIESVEFDDDDDCR